MEKHTSECPEDAAMPDTLSPKGSKNTFPVPLPCQDVSKDIAPLTGRRVFADNIDEIQRSLEDIAAIQIGRYH